ncbi:hypothetical protein J6590_015216 [Homalodisca vitripennis]|nr:hypothetical protein J6590_015216 [Homalodisca vitripennis]
MPTIRREVELSKNDHTMDTSECFKFLSRKCIDIDRKKEKLCIGCHGRIVNASRGTARTRGRGGETALTFRQRARKLRSIVGHTMVESRAISTHHEVPV